jgi:hypothetical protein
MNIECASVSTGGMGVGAGGGGGGGGTGVGAGDGLGCAVGDAITSVASSAEPPGSAA